MRLRETVGQEAKPSHAEERSSPVKTLCVPWVGLFLVQDDPSYHDEEEAEAGLYIEYCPPSRGTVRQDTLRHTVSIASHRPAIALTPRTRPMMNPTG